MDYSQPMSDSRRALVLRLHQTVCKRVVNMLNRLISCGGFSFQEEDKEEMKEILEMKRTHDKLIKKKQTRISKEKAVIEAETIIMKS